MLSFFFFFFQAEDGIRDIGVTGVQTCALPISAPAGALPSAAAPATAPADGAPAAAGAATGIEDISSALFDYVGFERRFRGDPRSGERRVGEECRSRWWPYHLKKKINKERASEL